MVCAVSLDWEVDGGSRVLGVPAREERLGLRQWPPRMGTAHSSQWDSGPMSGQKEGCLPPQHRGPGHVPVCHGFCAQTALVLPAMQSNEPHVALLACSSCTKYGSSMILELQKMSWSFLVLNKIKYCFKFPVHTLVGPGAQGALAPMTHTHSHTHT